MRGPIPGQSPARVKPLAPGRIARFMRPEELHTDVSELIERLRALLLGAVAVVTLATSSRPG